MWPQIWQARHLNPRHFHLCRCKACLYVKPRPQLSHTATGIVFTSGWVPCMWCLSSSRQGSALWHTLHRHIGPGVALLWTLSMLSLPAAILPWTKGKNAVLLYVREDMKAKTAQRHARWMNISWTLIKWEHLIFDNKCWWQHVYCKYQSSFLDRIGHWWRFSHGKQPILTNLQRWYAKLLSTVSCLYKTNILLVWNLIIQETRNCLCTYKFLQDICERVT